MLKRVHRHPDGGVIVEDGISKSYKDTDANFAADYGSAFPAYDNPTATEKCYLPDDGVHFEARKFYRWDKLPTPWAAGDAILAAIDSLIAAYDARQPTPPAPPATTAAEAGENALKTRGTGSAVDVTRTEFNQLLDYVQVRDV